MEIFILLFTFYIVGGDGNEKWNKNCMFHWSTLIFSKLGQIFVKNIYPIDFKMGDREREEDHRAYKRRRRNRTSVIQTVLQTILFAIVQTILQRNVVHLHGGSFSGRNANLNRSFRRKEWELFRNYFGPNPLYSQKHFRRRYRMPFDLFMRIHDDVTSYDSYFQAKRNCAGLLGNDTIQ